MKNLLLLCVALLCVYLYLNPQQERTMVTPTSTAVASQGPKVYFHSPLDAGAMPTNMSTGTGYFSTDQDSRFNNYRYHSAVGHGGAAAGGFTSYGAGGSVSHTTIYNTNTGSAGSNFNASTSSRRSYVTGPLPNGGSDSLTR